MEIVKLVNAIWLVYGLAAIYFWWKNRRNPFGLAKPLNMLGAFVWGDGLMVGLFWTIAGAGMLIANREDLFILVWLVFWWVRALGEVIYWLNEQFMIEKRNKPADLWGHELLPGEAIYFGYQLFWQMVLVGCSLGILWQVGLID